MAASESNNGFDWRAFDAYLFDIDGTLLNSRDGVHYHSFHAALRHAWNCDVKIDNVPVHGNTDIGILRAAATMGNIDEVAFRSGLRSATDEMCSEVERNASQMTPALCPAIPALLKALAEASKLLAVASGNLEPIGWAKLRAAGIAQYFSFGSFSGERELRIDIFRWGADRIHQLLGPEASVCVVGDTPNDIHAAQALRLPVIAVATGTYSRDQLASLGPDLCISSCETLWV
jgi:phosphoglycolate phosphatase-like HAD superfamily hydrolase